MIPTATDREIKSSGIMDFSSFGISEEDEIHIMTILRDTLYSDKVLAVLREYASNAYDAHCVSGKREVPIEVRLPTVEEPTLYIRDYGFGISHENISKVYVKYGASTKRSDNNTVGMLGIGSKSGFSYTDSFTVTSWHAGTKSTYVAALDEMNRGKMFRAHEEPCGEETGVQIQIAVKPKDIYEFTEKAKQLFPYFRPQPKINVELKNPYAVEPGLANESTIGSFALLGSGAVTSKSYDGGGQWYAVMGCVPYRINTSQLRDLYPKLNPVIRRCNGYVSFDIGEVHVSASREDLKYSDFTKDALVRKFNDLTDELVSYSLDKIEKEATSKWEQKCIAREMVNMGIPAPVYNNYVKGDTESLAGPPESIVFRSKRRGYIVQNLLVSRKSRLILRDINSGLSRYEFDSSDVIVSRSKTSVKFQKIEEDLKSFITERGMDGVTVVKLSSLKPEYTKPVPVVTAGTKHPRKCSAFRLRDDWHTHANKADRWEAVPDHEPQDSDVFVVMERFDYQDLYSDISDISAVLKFFGEKLPAVYGYKSTTNPTPSKGTVFRQWIKQKYASLFAEKTTELEQYWVSRRFSSMYIQEKDVKRVEENLGSDHEITKILQKILAATVSNRISYLNKNALAVLYNSVNDDDNSVDSHFGVIVEYKKLLNKYELISRTSHDLTALVDDHWVKYVQIIDIMTQTAEGNRP